MYVSLGPFFEVVIRLFTICQIEYCKFMRELGWPVYYKFFLGQSYPPPTHKTRTFYYIKDGAADTAMPQGSYDFVLCEDGKKRALLRGDYVNNIDGSYSPEVSDITFISTELHIADKSFEFELETAEYNYYVVGNVLDDAFFKYFIQKHYATEYKETFDDETFALMDGKPYVVHIIDHNVEIVQFDPSKQIHVQEKGYNLTENNINK
jgi:hypothetical protein